MHTRTGVLLSVITLLLFTYPLAQVYAQASDVILEGKIENIRTIEKEFVGQVLPVLVLDTRILTDPMKGVVVKIDQPPSQKDTVFRIGDRVLVSASSVEGRDPVYYIVDVVRTDSLRILLFIFMILVLVVAGWQGVRSLLGLSISFFVLMTVVMPKLFAGQDPVMTAVFGAFIIAPLTFYFTHGLNRKTTIALAGTAVSLLVTAVFSHLFITLGKLTGYASEEVQFLQIAKGGTLNPQGLLLAGIIIGTLGILDDVTISQASVVSELKKANKKLRRSELFIRAMRVGRDHIAATVNTLVLVYTGASLPLLLLFLNSSQPFAYLVNYEIVAEEITRSLVGSIGLILAVPITTALSVFVNQKTKSGI